MDLKVVFSTFGMIFLAELGDKTQLATLCFAAESKSRLAVFDGSAAVQFLCTRTASQHSGVLLVELGLWMIFVPGNR